MTTTNNNFNINININPTNNYMNRPTFMGPQPFLGMPSPFGGFPQLQPMFQQNPMQMMMGLLSMLATRLPPPSFSSGQVGFRPQPSGSRVDELLQKHGNDPKGLARELGVSGRKDVERINDATRALSNTPGPTVRFGGQGGTPANPGLGNEKITLPPDLANRIARCNCAQTGEKMLREWMEQEAGTSDSREILNQVMGTGIKSGREKNAGSELMLDTMIEQSVKTMQSGRMLDLCGRPTCCIPCYHCPVELCFGHESYDEAARKIGDLASPLSLDLDGDGQLTSDRMVDFDIDGDGQLDRVNDIDDGDALLVFDADGDGIAGENGTELLGDNTDLDGDGQADGFKDGFEALEALARREGLIGPNDTELSDADLKVLQDKYGLALRRGGLNGQDTSFSAADVAALNVGQGPGTRETNFDGRGNDVTRREGAGFTRTDGSTGEMADIWFQK